MEVYKSITNGPPAADSCMPRHRPFLHASAAFWPVNSRVSQPDHPVLAPDPFTQTHYETERIQVPEAKVSIPAVRLPAGVQVWKGIADSVSNTHGYLPKPNQTYTPVELPHFNHSGFYGSSETAQGYSATKRTEEDTPGIELSFVTKHNLKLIDIGDVETANAIRELINTVTPEKVAADPRYYYFLEMVSGAFRGPDYAFSISKIKEDHGTWVDRHKELLRGTPYGSVTAVSCYLERYKKMAHAVLQNYYDPVFPLDWFGIAFQTPESLFEFLMNYDDFEHDNKIHSFRNATIDQLFTFYTYLDSRQDTAHVPLEEKVAQICKGYFDMKQHGLDEAKIRKLARDAFTEKIQEIQKGLVQVLGYTLSNTEKIEEGYDQDTQAPFALISRFSQAGIDISLVRLLERFVLKFCYFDGWIYIANTDAVLTNLNTAARRLTYNLETSVLQRGFHSEIYLTDQGKAKIDYVGYNRFDT